MQQPSGSHELREVCATPTEEKEKLSDLEAPGKETRCHLLGKRVVIVEDEAITQMQLRKALGRAGLILSGCAVNGKEGVEIIQRECPELVLMDIQMPIMNGLEAVRLVMQQCPTCIVMLSAFSGEDYQEEAKRLGVSGYIVKPITAPLLLLNWKLPTRDTTADKETRQLPSLPVSAQQESFLP